MLRYLTSYLKAQIKNILTNFEPYKLWLKQVNLRHRKKRL